MNMQSQIAYDFIRKRIISGEYAPDSFISGKGLAGEIGVSRTPIRDALRQLEQEGLVKMTPGYGAQVRSLSPDEFAQIWVTRVALEGMAGLLAAKFRSEEDLALMDVNMRALWSEARAFDPATWTAADQARFAVRDRAFHELILAATRNRILADEAARLHLIQTTIFESREDFGKWMKSPLLTCQEHQGIIEAIRNQESKLARSLVEEHLEYSATTGELCRRPTTRQTVSDVAPVSALAG